jgi:O-antigen ligase
MPVLVREWKNILNIISDIIPPFRRIAVLFTDFRIAFSEAGSGRDVTWETAMRLIRISPIFGIGIGTYTGITALEWGVRSIAHNTYLQMAAEWGLPLAVLFFAVVVWLLIQSSREIYNFEIVKISIDIILVFLLGSLALSLNNARMFWFTLGLLFFYQSKQRKVAVA